MPVVAMPMTMMAVAMRMKILVMMMVIIFLLLLPVYADDREKLDRRLAWQKRRGEGSHLGGKVGRWDVTCRKGRGGGGWCLCWNGYPERWEESVGIVTMVHLGSDSCSRHCLALLSWLMCR